MAYYLTNDVNGVKMVTHIIPLTSPEPVQCPSEKKNKKTEVPEVPYMTRMFLKGEPVALGTVQIMIGIIMITMGAITWFTKTLYGEIPLVLGLSIKSAIALNIISALLAISGICYFCFAFTVETDLVACTESNQSYYYYNCMFTADNVKALLYGIKGMLLVWSVLEVCVCTTTVIFSCKANVQASSSKMSIMSLYPSQIKAFKSSEPKTLGAVQIIIGLLTVILSTIVYKLHYHIQREVIILILDGAQVGTTIVLQLLTAAFDIVGFGLIARHVPFRGESYYYRDTEWCCDPLHSVWACCGEGDKEGQKEFLVNGILGTLIGSLVLVCIIGLVVALFGVYALSVSAIKEMTPIPNANANAQYGSGGQARTNSITGHFIGHLGDQATVNCSLENNQFLLCEGSQERAVPLKRAPFCPIKLLSPSEAALIPPDILQRGVDVGVAILLQSANQRLLLTRRAHGLRIFPNVWVPPGGHVELDEKLLDAGLRELREETGLQLDPDDISSSQLLGLWEVSSNTSSNVVIFIWEIACSYILTLSQSVYPPMLSRGLPQRHHIVTYVLLCSKYTHLQLQSCIKPEPTEVSACVWVDADLVRAIVSAVDGEEKPIYLPADLPQSVSVTEVSSDGKMSESTLPVSVFCNQAPAEGEDVERVSTGTKYALELWLNTLRASCEKS
ncbi:Nucleoside diphosphate-linked moiety X motif 17 [Bagarius yarrelli]|uniref:m7GpppN-mRNA hydrolase NUDT17 n=1 Tax=Bagarius yarrelli TaxID=175774 RepID=A0A556TQ00_BAGYA|nr:Nucleoside diphosphate-linked moiety X motif 17 [Bagarius yarrelli]